VIWEEVEVHQIKGNSKIKTKNRRRIESIIVTVAGTCLVYLANRHAAYRETLNGINHKRNTEKDKTKKSLDIRKVAKGMLNIESQKSQREAAVVLEIAIETIKSHRHNNNSSENSKCVGCVPNSWL
jgi:hypothetical protein